MNYIEEIKQDMYAAMKSKDKVKATILRSLLSNLKKIEIEKKEREERAYVTRPDGGRRRERERE